MKQRRIRRDLVLVIVGLAAGLLLMRFFGGASDPRAHTTLPEGSVTLASETDQTPPTSDDQPRGSLLAKWKPQPLTPPAKKSEETAKDPTPTPTQDAPAAVEQTPPAHAPKKDRLSNSALAEQMLIGAVPMIAVEAQWEGEAPEERTFRVSDPKCRELLGSDTIASRDFDLHGDHLAGVVVTIEGPRWTIHNGPAVLDQRGCRFEPQVFAVQAGETFEIKNSDPTLHNIHLREFNQAMPKQGQSIKRILRAVEGPIEIRCDVHDFMRAHAYVFERENFATTDERGAIYLEDVVPGRYTFVAQHPFLETQRQTINYTGGAVRVVFAFRRPATDTTSEKLSKR